MAFKQPNNPFSQRSYQKAQTKRFGHQKESKFQYDIRMRKEGNKAMGTRQEKEDLISTKNYFSVPNIDSNVTTEEIRKPGDYRKIDNNFGITSDMDWKTAYTTAYDQGIQPGQSFKFRGEEIKIAPRGSNIKDWYISKYGQEDYESYVKEYGVMKIEDTYAEDYYQEVGITSWKDLESHKGGYGYGPDSWPVNRKK